VAIDPMVDRCRLVPSAARSRAREVGAGLAGRHNLESRAARYFGTDRLNMRSIFLLIASMACWFLVAASLAESAVTCAR
jgi:hypothetical protein